MTVGTRLAMVEAFPSISLGPHGLPGPNLVDGQLAKAPLDQSPVLTLITHEQAIRTRLTPERINQA